MKPPYDDLLQKLRSSAIAPAGWKRNDFDLFFEVEGLLYVHEYVLPDVADRNARQTWAVVSGYFVAGTPTDRPDMRQALLNARQQIRYVRTASSWYYWLGWYRKQPDRVRLYRFKDDGQYEQNAGVALRQERLLYYQHLMQEPGIPEPSEDNVAGGETYTFELDREKQRVHIPAEFADYANVQAPAFSLNPRSVNPPIEIDLHALEQSAVDLDKREHGLALHKPHYWQKRLKPLQFHMRDGENGIHNIRRITIDGFFHLVGPLGAGKSTLIWLLIYHVAVVMGRHVSVVMNTVVESYQLARWLRLMGVRATPALGRNRAEHARRLGFAHREIFNSRTVFSQPDSDEPYFRWLPKPCALGALARVDIPAGWEPCYQLRDETGKRHRCPLLETCPVHQLDRDMLDSQVWVLNPASFLYSRLPSTANSRRTYLFEAVYHNSDLLIIDEADRVQANWDNAFAPTSVVLGAEDALLDWLHAQLTTATLGANRSSAARNTINRLTNMDDQSNMLANRAYRLLSRGRKKKWLVEWIQNWQIVNVSLFSRLNQELKRAFPKDMDDAEKERRLDAIWQAFGSYWKNPLTRESGDLAAWLNRFLGGDESERRLRRDLDNWLIGQMGWQDAKSQRYRRLCRKLELCIVLTALIKRINDLQYQLPWAEQELNEKLPSGSANIPRALTGALPEPPLGAVLGLRAIQAPKAEQPTFHAMRYSGMGRWLLLNFHQLYLEQSGVVGPNVMLTSATSWFPGSATFHIARPPQALLINDAIEQPPVVHVQFNPIKVDGYPLRISGLQPDRKEQNLRRVVRELAARHGDSPSDLELELMYWRDRGMQRRVLLVVNSYDQANIVIDELERNERWRGRAMRLFPDDSELSQYGIRTREVEGFHQYDADILVAPLLAVQRGFNILDEPGQALLGTAYFLVRPFPPPDDLSAHIMSLNTWFIEQLVGYGRELKPDYGDSLEAIAVLRRAARKQWQRRLNTRGYLSSMDDARYREYLHDSFVTIWQTVGRLLRGGRSARVIFVDAAFGTTQGNRNILQDWHEMLEALFDTDDPFDKQLATELYGVAWHAFETANKQRRI